MKALELARQLREEGFAVAVMQNRIIGKKQNIWAQNLSRI